MSINALNSVSLYEYYYQINNDKKTKETQKTQEESKTAKELKKLGIIPTDDENKNVKMLKEAQEELALKELEENPKDRPWADIMYQLDLSFNSDPKDDVEKIKTALMNLMNGLNDEELASDINDLKDYMDRLYSNYTIGTNTNVPTSLMTQLERL